MRSRLDGLPPGTDVVVRALPATAAISYRELGADLDAALGTALQDAIRPARGAGDRGRP
jgi:ribonuclease P protein component